MNFKLPVCDALNVMRSCGSYVVIALSGGRSKLSTSFRHRMPHSCEAELKTKNKQTYLTSIGQKVGYRNHSVLFSK